MYNPYYQNYMSQIPRTDTPYTNPTQIYKPLGIQGKTVDSFDVVKAMDIPLDGSISYFPLIDGTAIITKQLQQDGTSKMVVYKPIENDVDKKESVVYITQEQLDEKIKFLNENKPDYKEDIKKINRKIEDLIDDIANINKSIKKRKDE